MTEQRIKRGMTPDQAADAVTKNPDSREVIRDIFSALLRIEPQFFTNNTHSLPAYIPSIMRLLRHIDAIGLYDDKISKLNSDVCLRNPVITMAVIRSCPEFLPVAELHKFLEAKDRREEEIAKFKATALLQGYAERLEKQPVRPARHRQPRGRGKPNDR